MRRGPLSGASRIGLVLLRGLGDIVWGLAVVRALKRQNPGHHIHWIVHPMGAPLLVDHPDVDRVTTYDPGGGWSAGRKLRAELRSTYFDVLLNFTIYLHGFLPVVLARAGRRIGFGPDRARDGMWLLAGERLPAVARRHMQDEYLEFADVLGATIRPVEWQLPLTEAEIEQREQFVSTLDGRPCVATFATAGRPEKDWSVGRHAALAGELNRSLSATVVLLGGPGELENERARAIVQGAGVPVRNELGPDLRRMITLLSACDVVVAPDTGPVHIARALHVPVVGLYGHTDPARYGPYEEQHLVVDRYHYDADDLRSGWQGTGGRAGRMELIDVEDVLKRVHMAVKQTGTRDG